MTIAQALSSRTHGNSRWLLLGSLALNLFFVGAAIALAVRPPASPSRWDPNVFVRVERVAAALPPQDAKIVRDLMNANHDLIERTQDKYHDTRDSIRETLRHDPFSIDQMRAAMAESRAARQAFDEAIQGVFANAAAKMSPEGRHALGNWRNSSKKRSNSRSDSTRQ
jgi:uncharacterized membrane protein